MPLPDDTPSAADFSGRQIGDFRLLRRLGHGAMAEVYLAEQCRLKRWVAIKILRPHLANDRTYLRRFEREAQAAASLVHANIVQVHEVGDIDGLHFIVQEYINGQNLRDWLTRNGPPDLAKALSIMRQIASALAKAAEQGVVHRDIKPENILITSAGEVKVADFGLARVAQDPDVTDLTQIGITMGTPLYMSPEQVEGRPLDHRSDLYSFGVTCYHMLAGDPPFVGETALAIAVQHVKKPPPALETVRPDLPAALCRVVHQMLAKAPDQRWQSCGDLLRELYRIRLEYLSTTSTEELESWGAVELEPMVDGRIRATRQLEEAMRKGRASRGWRPLLLWTICALVVMTFSGLTAWATMRHVPLLPQHRPQSHFPKQPTVVRQWYYASLFGTEEAWQSVIDYYKEKANECYTLRAKQQLGRIYLRERDYDRAVAVFGELANVGDQYIEFRVFGLAGKCSALAFQGKSRESADVLDELLFVLDELWPQHHDLDPQMKRMLTEAINLNRQKLGASGAALDQMLKEEFHPDG